MAKPVSYYDKGDMARSLQKMQSGESQPGQKHKPLLNIPFGSVIIDELHLLLRVTDVWERNVALEVVECDAAEGVTSLSKGPHLKSFLEVVKCLGITFTVWESRKVGKNVEFTSLLKRLLVRTHQSCPSTLKRFSTQKHVEKSSGYGKIL